LGNFGKLTGEIGTVEQSNDDDAILKWDDDGRTQLRRAFSTFSSSALMFAISVGESMATFLAAY
jgi:hypothetical protein